MLKSQTTQLDDGDVAATVVVLPRHGGPHSRPGCERFLLPDGDVVHVKETASAIEKGYRGMHLTFTEVTMHACALHLPPLYHDAWKMHASSSAGHAATARATTCRACINQLARINQLA